MPKNLFTKENQPAKRGTRKGVPNVSTLLDKWLSAKIKFNNKDEDTQEPILIDQKEELRITLFDAVILGLIQKAQGGDIAAIKELLDRKFGKVPNVSEISGPGSGPIEVKSIDEFNKTAAARLEAVEAAVERRNEG